MSDALRGLLEHAFINRALISGTFSYPKGNLDDLAKKITVKPIKTKAGYVFQFEKFYPTRVLHENLKPPVAFEKALALVRDSYRQTVLFLPEADYHILSSPTFDRFWRKREKIRKNNAETRMKSLKILDF